VALAAILLGSIIVLAWVAWMLYLRAARLAAKAPLDTSPYSLTDVFDEHALINTPHQKGIRWLTEVFSRSAAKYPDLPALQIPHTGETLTYAELDARAERIACAVAPYLYGPDQVVGVAMTQDNADIVAAHLGILRAGGVLVVLDTSLPDALITHMLNDAQPAVVLTRGQEEFRDLPTLDLLELPENLPERLPPWWMDDPTERLATIFYTSGTTGMPKGVECAHAGYVNLALTYAEYFGLAPGMDATTLTSSLGYDGSISEMYSAWVAGCTVVMLTKEEIRSGPDLVPVLREAEVTVLFCPPVLLTTLTSEPEIDLPYPLCRYIVPAGEAFPAALVEPWTRARRQIINTYGPTEASTDTSRQSLRAGEPITIGSPFPNVTYVILEVGELTPLAIGETGELCIGGVHLARGYRNLPQQTAEKFITHPRFGRLYRTGDKCRIDPQTKRVHYLGRIDAQLKVRGHRVEAQAVEDILQNQFAEIEAAVLDYQSEALIAFVKVPALNGEALAAAPTEWAARVTNVLARQLPGPSVPSRIFLVRDFVMKPVSGKIDRKALPDLSRLLEAGAQPAAATRSAALPSEAPNDDPDLPAEAGEVLAICRRIFETPIGWDHRFADAGGHSIAIARLARALQTAGWNVSVRALLSDCNTPRKVAMLERHAQPAPHRSAAVEREAAAARDETAAEVLSVAHFTFQQAVFAALLYAPALAAFVAVIGNVEIGTFVSNATIWDFFVAGAALYALGLGTPFVFLAWVMAIKFFAGGHIFSNNLQPGTYPKWSRMHLQVWCISRLEAMVLTPLGAMYRSPPLMAFALRLLGAKVGRNLQIAPGALLAGPIDLMAFGDDVAIQTGAYVQTTRWLDQNMIIGPLHIGSECKIGMRAGVGPNVRIGEGTWVTPFTPILDDVGPNEMVEGAPARTVGRFTRLQRPLRWLPNSQPLWFLETCNIGMQILIYTVLSVIPTTLIVWFAREWTPIGEAAPDANFFGVTPLPDVLWSLTVYAFITTWLMLIVTSVLTCLFIRFTRTSPGMFNVNGLRGALLLHRMGQLNGIQATWTWTITGQYLRALAGLRFSRVGAAECDIMFNLVPEAATADALVFWSNGSYTNMLDYDARHITLRRLSMPTNFFSGNNCVAEYGRLPANFLIGVSTPCSEIDHRQQMRSRLDEPATVAGNPPVQFPRAPEPDDQTNVLPTFPLFLTRVVLNDFFSIGTLRMIEGLLFSLLFICALRLGLNAIVSAVAAFVLAETILIGLSIAMKKLLVGDDWGRDHATPFWSWKHFAYFFSQDCFFAWCQGPLAFSAGTILANPVLRGMGCRIGDRTLVLEPMQCSDWNAVSFGQDCVIGGFLQFHTFENMMLKVKRAHIGDRSSVAFGATVMSGAQIEQGSTIQPLALVLKEMDLPTGTYYGSPAEYAPVDRRAVESAVARQPLEVADAAAS
jgi:non-ribosomal peptide synthetase-like protein